MRDHWRLDPDHIVPLGIDPTNEPETYDVSTPPKVLVPGRVTQKKGQKRVLNRLDPSLDLQVDVVGSIADKAYRDCIRGDWTFHGFVDRSTLDRFYREADVVVVPSYHENFSMTALEAVASGCALVVTDTCGFAQFEDVRRSDGVSVVANGSEAAEAVRDFATGSGLVQRKRAAHELSKHYRWSRIADRYCDFYQRVG